MLLVFNCILLWYDITVFLIIGLKYAVIVNFVEGFLLVFFERRKVFFGEFLFYGIFDHLSTSLLGTYLRRVYWRVVLLNVERSLSDLVWSLGSVNLIG